MGMPGSDGERGRIDPVGVERALGEIVGRLGIDYPMASPDEIARLLRSTYERTIDAPVQQYRFVLAERDARVSLRIAQREAMARLPFG
jgi:hypothetical protein